MSSGTDTAAGRRMALIERSDRNREALAATVGGLERQFAVAELVVAAVRRLRWNRGVVGAAALGLILAPAAARHWVRRALLLAPLALEGYRIARGLGEARRPESPHAGDE